MAVELGSPRLGLSTAETECIELVQTLVAAEHARGLARTIGLLS
eukprot:SAG31_NODE_860_length_11431_cov_8.068920_2_plen_44_part_00